MTSGAYTDVQEVSQTLALSSLDNTLQAFLQQIMHNPVEDKRCRGRDILFRRLGDSDIPSDHQFITIYGKSSIAYRPLGLCIIR